MKKGQRSTVPCTDAQKVSQQENWALHQLASMKSNLSGLRSMEHLPKGFKELGCAALIGYIDYQEKQLRNEQKLRMERNKQLKASRKTK